jgi:hypothetical protein
MREPPPKQIYNSFASVARKTAEANAQFFHQKFKLCL